MTTVQNNTDINSEYFQHNSYLEKEYNENKEVVEKNTENLRRALTKFIQENKLDDEFFRGDMFEKLIKWIPKNPANISSINDEKLNENIIINRIQYLYNDDEDRRGILLELKYPWRHTYPGSIPQGKGTHFYSTIWWLKEKENFEGQWTTTSTTYDLKFFEGNKLWKDGGYFKDKEIFKPNIETNGKLIAHYAVSFNLYDGIHHDLNDRKINQYGVVIECDNDFYNKFFSKILEQFIQSEKLHIMEIPVIRDSYFPQEISFDKIRFYKLPLPGVFEPERYEDDKENGGTIERFGFEVTPQNHLEIYCNVASLEYLHFACFKERNIDPFVWGLHVGSFKNQFIEEARFHFDYFKS